MTYQFPRCQIVPLADHQVSFQIDGSERLRWHFGSSYTRPFFFPLLGPTIGLCLGQAEAGKTLQPRLD